MDSHSVPGISRWRSIRWILVGAALAAVAVAIAPLVNAGIDHADESPGRLRDWPPPNGVSGVRRRPGPMDTSTWHFWLGTVPGVLRLTLFALPVVALAVWILARRRGAAGAPSPWRTSLAEVGIVFGTAPWVWLTMLPGGPVGVTGRVSLVPLRDLTTILNGGPLTAMVQIGGNLLMFAALGFFAPIRFRALASVPRVLALAAGCSILIETAQYVLRLDRVSSIDDVLLNAVGAGLAALASRRLWRVAPSEPPAHPRSDVLVGASTGGHANE